MSATALPRTVLATLALVAATSWWAAVTGLGRAEWVPPMHWAALTLSALALALAACTRPDSFRLREFRLPGVAVVALGVFILIPLPGQVRRFDDQIPRETVLAIAAGLVVMALVFAVLPTTRPPGTPRIPPPRRDRPWRLEPVVPTVIAITAAAMLPMWVRTLGALPILQLITGQATGIDIALARFGALRGLESGPLRLVVGALRNVYLLYAVGFFVAWFVTTRRDWYRTRIQQGLLAGGVFALAAMFAVVTTERAILGQVIVVALIAALLSSGRRLTGRLFALLAAAVLLFPIAFAVLNASAAGASPIRLAFESIRRRLFFVPSDVMMQYFASFPGRRDFLRGASIPKVSRLWGGQTFDLSGFVYESAYRFDERFSGNANGTFLGVGWANFGLVGVVLWCAVVAIGLVVLQRCIGWFPTRSSAALQAVAAVQVALLSSSDFTRTVFSFGPGFLDVVVLSYVAIAIERRRTSPAVTHGRVGDVSPRRLATPRGS